MPLDLYAYPGLGDHSTIARAAAAAAATTAAVATTLSPYLTQICMLPTQPANSTDPILY